MDLEALIVLGGGLIKDRYGQWRTTHFDDIGDSFGILGDRVRVVSACYIKVNNQNMKLIVSGGKGQLSHIPDCPTLASVLKKELIELCINPKSIIEEDESSGTKQQLENSLAIVSSMNLARVGIISNRYHLPRIEAFLDHISHPNIHIELISAEEIALENDPEFWKKEIDEAYATEEMKKRISLEQKGVRDLRSGKYKF